MGPESINSAGESTTPTIPLTLGDDGVSQITASFLDLEQIGSYILSVTPQDVAGNTAAGAVEYRFILDIPLPRVGAVVIGEISRQQTSSDVALCQRKTIWSSERFFIDPTETGLSFGSEGSVITVTESDGTTVVPGTNRLQWRRILIVWEPITLDIGWNYGWKIQRIRYAC